MCTTIPWHARNQHVYVQLTMHGPHSTAATTVWYKNDNGPSSTANWKEKKYGAHGRTDKARVEQWSCALKSVQEMASQPNQPAAYYMYVSVFLSFSRIVLAIQQNLT